MGSRWVFLLSLLPFTIAQAQTGTVHTYTANGRTFTYTLRVFDPPVAIQFDPSKLNQDTAVNCTLLFMSRLSKGDFSGAASITTDPESTLKTYTEARARVGDAEFIKQLTALYGGDHYRFELVEGHEHLLISENMPDGAQAVIEKDGKFWMDHAKFQHESQEFHDLFALVNDHAAGRVEFK